MIIEYGASTNLLNAGMASLLANEPPGYEKFVLSSIGCEAILKFIGERILLDAGVLMPAL
ncbi:MAG: hypothetical protein A3E01_00645 [Gammaproteobacteria bacterium RIFCSPHIGHO2_12_FULL_63_22]|nr:MAG: hypothetical protein A3E01_00645 [Gammaproteobacteria bacterium RIFCSPHIGHO2_12_FULL_63_22]